MKLIQNRKTDKLKIYLDICIIKKVINVDAFLVCFFDLLTPREIFQSFQNLLKTNHILRDFYENCFLQ